MLKDALKRAFVPRAAGAPPVPPGLTSFTRESQGLVARFHLRVEPDGSGLLLANAASACRLSAPGVLIAERLLSGAAPEEVAKEVGRRFSGVGAGRVEGDVRRVAQVLEEMVRPDGGWPLRDLDERGTSAHRRTLSAPLAADVEPAEDPERAREILDRLWEVGVPQAVLVLGEGQDARPLVPLVERAEDLGMIAGVRGRATDLPGDGVLDALVEAGLDRLDVFWGGADHDDLFGAGDRQATLDRFETARRLETCPVAVVPVVDATLGRLGEIVGPLPEQGVPAVVFYALVAGDLPGALRPEALAQAAAEAEEAADRLGLNLVWAAPSRPAAGESLVAAARRGPRCAGEAAVRVRADGGIVPPTGPARSAGSLLEDPWSRIWDDPAFAAWRSAVDDPPRCDACPGLAVCAAGCPKDPASWALADEGGLS